MKTIVEGVANTRNLLNTSYASKFDYEEAFKCLERFMTHCRSCAHKLYILVNSGGGGGGGMKGTTVPRKAKFCVPLLLLEQAGDKIENKKK